MGEPDKTAESQMMSSFRARLSPRGLEMHSAPASCVTEEDPRSWHSYSTWEASDPKARMPLRPALWQAVGITQPKARVLAVVLQHGKEDRTQRNVAEEAGVAPETLSRPSWGFVRRLMGWLRGDQEGHRPKGFREEDGRIEAEAPHSK